MNDSIGCAGSCSQAGLHTGVVQRKMSGGTRSPVGTSTFTTLQTLFGTWRARNLDALVACSDVLLAQATAEPV